MKLEQTQKNVVSQKLWEIVSLCLAIHSVLQEDYLSLPVAIKSLREGYFHTLLILGSVV